MTFTVAQIMGLPFVNGGIAAAGAAAVSIPIAIHLLSRMRRKREVWAAMRFLQEAFRKHKNRLQLEQILLLIIRCLAILALSLALGGPQLAGNALGAGGSTRTVCLVIDDSLSSQALTPGSGASGGSEDRFKTLIATSKKIVSAMRSGERLGIWIAGRPSTMYMAPSVVDPPAVLQRLDSIKEARASRSDLAGALALVHGQLERDKVSPERALVIVISDLSENALDLDHPMPAEMVKLMAAAKVYFAPPAADAVNIQIASLTPRRRMVVVDPAHPTVIPLELRLRRFGADQPDALTSVELSVFSADSKDLSTASSTITREHRWSAGQSEAALNIELPAGASAAEGRAVIRVRIQTGGRGDSLAADDTRLAVVELRKKIRVAIIAEGDTPAPPDANGWPTQGELLGLMLAPRNAGPIEPVRMAAGNVDEGALAKFAAAMISRPDLLNDKGWTALKKMAQRGGLVWFFTPPDDHPATWVTNFKDKLGLPWQVGLEVQKASEQSNGWNAGDSPVPETLQLLSSDWNQMLTPLVVFRRLDVSFLPGRGAEGEVWLRVNVPNDSATTEPAPGSAPVPGNSTGPAPAPGAGDKPLLVVANVGEGKVLFLATAINPYWTNLLRKPLVIPLLHETLRGVLGTTPESAREAGIVSGDRPLLGKSWEGVDRLLLEPGHSATADLETTDKGIAVKGSMGRPGVYFASPPSGTLKLAVNVDAVGGDTRAIDTHRLADWLGTEGRWHWLDPAKPEAALTQSITRADLGWPLLWVTLMLLLLETFLARWLSHAKATGSPSLFSQIGRLWKGAGA